MSDHLSWPHEPQGPPGTIHTACTAGTLPRDRQPQVRLGGALIPLVLLGLLTGCVVNDLFGTQLWPMGPTDDSAAAQATDSRTNRADPVVQNAQTMLAKLGYDPGVVDGVEGPKTREAVRHFQQDTGQEIDGRLSQELLDSLNGLLRGGRGSAVRYRLEATSLPTYRPGSTFVYSDGRVETVVRQDGDRVRWRTSRGTVFTAYRNFVLPWATWVSTGEQGQSATMAEPDILWPLVPGKAASFTVTTTVRFGVRPDNVKEGVEQWDCKVEKAERISVVAGTFDTLKVGCQRSTQDSSPRLKRVWYYAPRIGHYVRINDFSDAEEQDRHVEVVAIRPGGKGWPPAARAGLGWALQHALESMSTDEQIEWSSSAIETRVTIRPSTRFERGDGKTCRNYLQIWSDPGGRHSYPGTACREPSGRWHVPGLSDDPEDARGLIGGLN